MKDKIVAILKGQFLVSEDSVKNWRFIVFAAFLALMMIASAHNAEKKVHEIAELDKRSKELRSEYVDVRSILMKLKMESEVVKKIAHRGLVSSNVPPKKIKVKSE